MNHEPLTKLAMRCGIPHTRVATELGISEKELACLDHGHAWLNQDGLRAVAQRLGANCSVTDVRVALLSASMTPAPRSHDMEERRKTFEQAVAGLRTFDSQAVDRLASELFPDELEREQLIRYSNRVTWKAAHLVIRPAPRRLSS